MKLYLAGPMSGIPKHNFPQFEKAARSLRARDHDVVSPHELDAEQERAASWASPDGAMSQQLWAECLARDIKIIVADGIESIVVLPGWAGSRGAALETYVGYRLQRLPVYHYGDKYLTSVKPSILNWVHTRSFA